MQSPSRGTFAAPLPSSALRLLRVLLIALPLLAVFAPKQAHAYAWMIKRGYPSCPACHADPSGGELLTAYGRMISGLTLSTDWSGSGGSGENESMRRFVLRRPESFAAHAKAADDDKAKADATADGDKPAAEGDKAEGDEAEGGDAKAEGEEAKPEGEAASTEAPAEGASTEAAAAASSSDSGESTFPNAFFGIVDMPEWLLLGGSFRYMNILPVGGVFRTFPMMADVYGMAQFGGFRMGGSIGISRTAAGSPYGHRAQITRGQDLSLQLISRTHYIGYDIIPEVTVRVGRLNLPFGVRIPEHTMWVRQATGTDRESSQEHGVALAYVGEKLRGEIMGIAGNYQMNPDKYRQRGYAGFLEYQVGATSTVGISSLFTNSATDRDTNKLIATNHMVHGLMARAGFGEKVAVLAEVDGIFTSRREAGYVGFAQLDVEALQGFHVLATGELLDRGYIKPVAGITGAPRVPGGGKPAVGGWLSLAWFVYSHFDIRIDAVKRTAEDLTFLGQLHVYL